LLESLDFTKFPESDPDKDLEAFNKLTEEKQAKGEFYFYQFGRTMGEKSKYWYFKRLIMEKKLNYSGRSHPVFLDAYI